MTQCHVSKSFDFKLIYANQLSSAAITKNGELYVWGSLNFTSSSYDIGCTRLIGNEPNFFVDSVISNNGIFFAICRILENGNYIKKIFYLDYNNSTFKPYIYEIKDLNINNNSKITPLKLYLENEKVYVICVENNDLIKEINEMNKKGEKSSDCEIEIIINNPEENAVKQIIQFSLSENLNNFIELFSSLSDNNISNLVKLFGETKKKEYKNNEIIEKEKEYNDLLLFFSKNREKEAQSLSAYLKKRISIIKNSFFTIVELNMKFKSEGFLQKIILNNLIYLNEKLKMKIFNKLLSSFKLNRRESSHFDHYEENELLNLIKIDRNKAKVFYDKFNESTEKIPDLELNETIFGQVFNYYKDVNGKHFFLRKGERLFEVDLEGEQAIDEGGPYHEVISCMCDELQSEYLDLFIKTPNNKNNLGELRDKYLINPDSNKTSRKKAYEFIGKLMGLAFSSGEVLNLNLHPIIWKYILEKEITFDEFETIDFLFVNNTIRRLEKALKEKNQEPFDSYYLSFVIKNSNETDIELKENGKEIEVNLDNAEEFIKLSKNRKIKEFETQMEWIKKGIYSVINKNILQILNWNQLEEMICGKNKLDIEEFKKNTKYDGYKGDEEIIKWFWEWLENSNDETQFKYLQFVSGRTRLPSSRFGFKYTHTISKISIDNSLPKSSTCFFTLKLPDYDSKDKLIEKMKYAIENSTEISDEH